MNLKRSIIRGKHLLNILIIMNLIALISVFLFKEEHDIISVIVTLILGISTIIQSERMANDTKKELDMEIKDRMPCLSFEDIHENEFNSNEEVEYFEPNFSIYFAPGYEDNQEDKRMYLAFYKNNDNSTRAEMEFKIKNISSTILSEINIFYVNNYETEYENWIPNCYTGVLKKIINNYNKMDDEDHKKFIEIVKANGTEHLYEYEKTLTNIEPNKSYLCHFAFEPENITYDDWIDGSGIYNLTLGFEMVSIYGDKYRQVVKVVLEQRKGMRFNTPIPGRADVQYIYRIGGVKSKNYYLS